MGAPIDRSPVDREAVRGRNWRIRPAVNRKGRAANSSSSRAVADRGVADQEAGFRFETRQRRAKRGSRLGLATRWLLQDFRESQPGQTRAPLPFSEQAPLPVGERIEEPSLSERIEVVNAKGPANRMV